jgi:phosphate uptake regulator
MTRYLGMFIAPPSDPACLCRCLERIGDHATNIAENVILLADASMIKDHSDVKEEGEGRRLS